MAVRTFQLRGKYRSEQVSEQNILRTEERGLLNVWTDFNRNSDSESPDDLIPNNILRAQTTRKHTASVITAIRWNTL